MLHAELLSVSTPHYDQYYAFEIFFHQVDSLDDETQYLFQEFDFRGNRYHNADKLFTGKQLKNRNFLSGLVSHFSHNYRITGPGNNSEIYFSHTGTPQKVDKILH